MTPEELTVALIDAKKKREAAWQTYLVAEKARTDANDVFLAMAAEVNRIAALLHDATDAAAGVSKDDKGDKK